MTEGIVLFFVSLAGFVFCSKGFFSALREDIVSLSYTSQYSRQALRLARSYKIMAWGTMTAFFLIHSLYTFIGSFQVT